MDQEDRAKIGITAVRIPDGIMPVAAFRTSFSLTNPVTAAELAMVEALSSGRIIRTVINPRTRTFEPGGSSE